MKNQINVDQFINMAKIALGVSADAKVYVGKNIVSCVNDVTADTMAYYVPYLFELVDGFLIKLSPIRSMRIKRDTGKVVVYFLDGIHSDEMPMFAIFDSNKLYVLRNYEE